MSKREYFVETHRNFKVSHQALHITSVNFQSKSIIGFTELQIVSQVDDLSVITLNCQQCSIDSIHLNDYMCDFTYSDPTRDILPSSEKKGPRKLDTFSSAHYEVVKSTDADFGNGELIIQIPALSAIKSAILERQTMHLCIAYIIENPTGGIFFSVNDQTNVTNDGDDKLKESLDDEDYLPHLFTCRRSNSSRLWFPCVDSFSESCTWDISITVDDIFTAVSSGELTDVEHNVQKRKKRFTYSLQIPTSPPNIGLAVGPFTPVVHPDMHEVVHFCLPTLKSLMLDTVAYTHRIFEYLEELLNIRYPYTTYKQVFVDNLDSKYEAYATLSIFPLTLLHSKHVIDQTYVTRKALASAIAEQFFGCFISMQSTADAWLTRGIAGFLAHDYFKKAFGNNQYRYRVKRAMDKIIKYEQQFRPIVLDPSTKSYTEKDYFHVKNFHTFSPLYDKMHRIKSFIIVRMLENYLDRELLLQVFNKMLSLAQIAAPQKFSSGNWFHLHASTSSFIWAISTVTGKNIDTFLKQWVFQGGHVKLTGSFIFNRKRNTVELEIKQVHISDTGIRRYLGPLMIWLQELDGTFKHNLQIEDNLSKHDITCHSKSRRNKKKKIPLCTGEEIDMDLTGMDQDSPVLWLRIDPEMNLLREILLEQPDYQWQYQLRYERDIIAQIESLEVLERFYSNPGTKNALIEIINNDQVFYRIRCEATFCLQKVANKMGIAWVGPPAMLNIFRKLFGSPSCPQIVRMNNFSNFQLYFIQKSIFVAMAGLRTIHGICPHEVLRFLLDLFKYNDNSKNKFSDAYFRAALIDALAATVTPAAITPVFNSSNLSDILSPDTKNILEEITRCFNLDKLLPSYKHVVTVSCLRAIRHLQKMGHLPSNPQIFRCHTSHNCFIDVRKVSIEILVDIVKAEVRKEDLDFLLDLVVNDPLPAIKFHTLKELVKNPPFSRMNEDYNPLDTEELVERLWSLMNNHFSCNSKLRCAVVDLYYVLYGRGRPRCLPKPEFSFVLNLKEKKAALSNSSSVEQPNKSEISENKTDELASIVKTDELPDSSNVNNPKDATDKNSEDKLEREQMEKSEESSKTKSSTETLSILPQQDEATVKSLLSPNLISKRISIDASLEHGQSIENEKLESVDEIKKDQIDVDQGEKKTNDLPIVSIEHHDESKDNSTLPISSPHSSHEAASSVIPTISIRMKGDPLGDSSSTLTPSFRTIICPSPAKKRKDDSDKKSDDGSSKEKHKDKHHKDKKKKKKKHKNKHKHKHKHHTADP